MENRTECQKHQRPQSGAGQEFDIERASGDQSILNGIPMTLGIESFPFQFFDKGRAIDLEQLSGATSYAIRFAQGFADQTVFVHLELLR